VEINSSFYRPHRCATYRRWAETVPDDFRFSVKIPRALTQTHRLKDYGGLLDVFLEQVSGLGGKLGVLLVQLPPSLVYEPQTAAAFFRDLARAQVTLACEPRHASWFTREASNALAEHNVVRVAADPPRAEGDGMPGVNTRLAYFRLHGRPKIYYSDYGEEAIGALASKLASQDWAIFDNTAASHALGNALALARGCRQI
jgi:uncharacterized protein YecE (DUF72 family)